MMCRLYPAPLRDFLLNLAVPGFFRARWTDEIHDERISNLLERRPDLNLEKLTRTRNLMNTAVQDCLITGYQSLIPGLSLPDENDRHVLAAAIHAGADVIVTFNKKDFPEAYLSQFGIAAQRPMSL